MRVRLEPGSYVVAVSGGVDSMVLLDLLVRLQKAAAGRQKNMSGGSKPAFRFIVAHFDHGIRPDSRLDRQLVQTAAQRYGLAFVYDQAALGPGVSEATARQKRYEFLNRIKKISDAKAVITAHHGDDLVETAVHNLLRGSGRKGLTSLNSDIIIRPLLAFSKSALITYAKRQGLTWREDSTNQDTRYRRNYIRHEIVPKLGADGLYQFKRLIETVYQLNCMIDQEIAKLLQNIKKENKLVRAEFIRLPHAVALEVMAAWLRAHDIRQFDKKTLERLVWAAKTFYAGKKSNIAANYWLSIGQRELEISKRQ